MEDDNNYTKKGIANPNPKQKTKIKNDTKRLRTKLDFEGQHPPQVVPYYFQYPFHFPFFSLYSFALSLFLTEFFSYPTCHYHLSTLQLILTPHY